MEVEFRAVLRTLEKICNRLDEVEQACKNATLRFQELEKTIDSMNSPIRLGNDHRRIG